MLLGGSDQQLPLQLFSQGCSGSAFPVTTGPPWMSGGVSGCLHTPAPWVTCGVVPPARPCAGVSQAGTTPNADRSAGISARPGFRGTERGMSADGTISSAIGAGGSHRGSEPCAGPGEAPGSGQSAFQGPHPRWEPAVSSTGGATAGSRAGSSQGPHGDLSSWRLPSRRVRCPTVTQRSSAQTSGHSAKPLRCLFRIGPFLRVENQCLLLTLQVEREERVFVPLPAPFHLHPTPGGTAVTSVPRCCQLERCLQPGVSVGQVPRGISPPGSAL